MEIINNRGEGMTFYALVEDYEELCKKVGKIYPNATVKIISKEIKVPKLSLDEQIMLGLIDVTKNDI